MINVSSNDSHIVDRDILIIELSRLMSLKQPILLRLNNEGPCAASLGLYNILDQLTARFEYKSTDIEIRTCNMLERHEKYKIVYEPQMMYLDAAKRLHRSMTLPNKSFKEDFLHFGNFVGHGNCFRLRLASYLYSNFGQKCLQSYHFDRSKDYYRQFVGLEEMFFSGCTQQQIDDAYSFLKILPLTIDDVETSPIMYPSTFNILKVYHRFFVDLVTVTYFSGNTFYIDEKIWRPIISRTPFMIQGSQNYIKNLRKLGFKTFDRWWDEGYSEDPADIQMPAVAANIKRISERSIDDLHDIYHDMSEVLEHNYQLLHKLTQRDFEKFAQQHA